MAIFVQMTKRWCYREDPDGNAIREFPPDRSYSIDDEDVALIAIAEGAAEAVEPLNDDQQKRLGIIMAAVAGDDDRVAALLGGTDTLTSGAGAGDPAPAKKKSSK